MDILKITMKEKERYEIIQKLITKRLTEEEAKKLMNLRSVRQVRRLKRKVLKEGLQGLIHGNRDKESPKKINSKTKEKIIKIYQEKYHDFKPTFATEKLIENHQIKISKESLRQILIEQKLWQPKSRKIPKQRHVWRERRSNYGEMQQFDGSYHKWFEDRAPKCCLLLSVDDATGRITNGKFDQNEGVVAVFKFWWEYGEINGFPCEIYLDKFSTYKINHKSAVDNKDLLTQFQRVTNQIGIRLITAHSPQAKGRVERMNETLQDRLIKELRLKNIFTIPKANKFLQEEFIPKFNNKFGVIPRQIINLHKPIHKELKTKLPQIFSIQDERKVLTDYTVMFKNQYFQLAEKQPTTVFKKDTVTIEEHLNDDLKICLNNKYLNYTILPARPKKVIDLPICALTKNKVPYIPPKDHPWRTKFVISHKTQKCTTSV